MRRVVLPLSLALAVTAAGCLPDDPFKRRGPTQPEALRDGWDLASPEEVGLDPEVLTEIHDQLLREDRHFGTLGLLVVKGGKLVWETYLRSLEDRDHVQHLQSVTKSITALALGLAQDRGHLLDLDATLGQLVPEELRGLEPVKRKITVEHLLTMRSGLSFDNDVFSVEMWVDRPELPLRYMLEKSLYADPGEEFYYRDTDPQIVAYLIEQETGEREREYVEEHLFAPLGIRRYHWEQGPDGVTLGAHALHLKPRDLAKIGLLLLNDCEWEGEAIVSREWCELITTEHVPPQETGHRREGFGYGYYFWTLVEHGAYAAWGHGGQFVLWVPAQDLVLVQVARPDTDDLHGGRLGEFVELTSPLWRANP